MTIPCLFLPELHNIVISYGMQVSTTWLFECSNVGCVVWSMSHAGARSNLNLVPGVRCLLVPYMTWSLAWLAGWVTGQQITEQVAGHLPTLATTHGTLCPFFWLLKLLSLTCQDIRGRSDSGFLWLQYKCKYNLELKLEARWMMTIWLEWVHVVFQIKYFYWQDPCLQSMGLWIGRKWVWVCGVVHFYSMQIKQLQRNTMSVRQL